jgi:TolB-like protein
MSVSARALLWARKFVAKIHDIFANSVQATGPILASITPLP